LAVLIRRPGAVAAAALDAETEGVVATVTLILPLLPNAPTSPVRDRAPGLSTRSARRAPRLAPLMMPAPRPPPALHANGSAPPATQPLFLSASVAQGLRVHDEFPELPGPLRVPGAHHDVTATICVSETGVVTTVAITSAGVPLLETVLATAIRSWRYRPCQIGGAARPFCHDIAFAYRMGSSAGQ
jgi:hypothetical protein